MFLVTIVWLHAAGLIERTTVVCGAAVLLIQFVLQRINLLSPTGHVMHQQFNIQQLYVLPTLFMCFVFI